MTKLPQIAPLQQHYVTLLQAKGQPGLFRPVVIHGDRMTAPNFNIRPATLRNIISMSMTWAECKGLPFRPDLAIINMPEGAPNLLGITADVCREMKRFPASIQWIFRGNGLELAINVWEDAQRVVGDVENLLDEVFHKPHLGDEPTDDEVDAIFASEVTK